MTAKTFLYFICSNEYVYDNFSYEDCYGTQNVSSCILYVDRKSKWILSFPGKAKILFFHWVGGKNILLLEAEKHHKHT